VIHGGIRLTEDVFGGSFVAAADGNPDARPGIDLGAGHRQRFVKLGEHAPSHQVGVLRRPQRLQEDGELVPA